MRQRTLRNSIKATGVSLHKGEKVYMTLHPAPVETGIVFRRTDLFASLSDCPHKFWFQPAQEVRHTASSGGPKCAALVHAQAIQAMDPSCAS